MSILKQGAEKVTRSSNSNLIPRDQTSFTHNLFTKSSQPEVSMRERSQQNISMKDNRTFDDEISPLDKSAEFPVKVSQGTDRRKQLNSSFEKPMSYRNSSLENKQPQRPALAKPTQSARILQTKQPVATRTTNQAEPEPPKALPHKALNSERNVRSTSLVRPAGTKFTSQKLLNQRDKVEEKYTKTLDTQPRHKSSSPLVKRDHNNELKSQYEARMKMKKAPTKQNYVTEKKTIGFMSTTPYSKQSTSQLMFEKSI